MKEISKVWGKEIVIADEPEYSGKILAINKGAGSSWHRHPKKEETFFCLKGRVRLRVKKYLFKRIPWMETTVMTPYSEPVNILPGQWHQFHGYEDSEIIEVATQDDPDLVERRSRSYNESSH